ncbi:phosphotransferase family protein [Pararhodobacter aggregans]|uniref:phosphotransferase family protein n=1 Tax=Pararhodobacter aggregans TaxID=404875 RepID=UPI003A902D41
MQNTNGNIDLGAVAAWMDSAGLGQGPIAAARPIPGGTQNVMLRFQRAGRAYVLRAPAATARIDPNRTVGREIRLLKALGGTGVPHAALIQACRDEAVIGRLFYLMEEVDGFNASETLPPLHAGNARIRHDMGLAIVDGALSLAAVDYRAAGLEDFGRPEGFLDRQVARWSAQLEGYHEYPGWPGSAVLGPVREVADWLEAHRPASFVPGIMHGDFHMANVMFRPDGPALAAIVDWELATIGDPLIDLGWLLATWPDQGPTRPAERGMIRWDGLPRRTALVARYAAGTGRDLSAVEWYAVFGCYKLGILLEGTHARACAGQAPRDTGDRLHAAACRYLARAQDLTREGIRD